MAGIARKAAPKWLRRVARSAIDQTAYNRKLWAKDNPYDGTEAEVEHMGSNGYTLGIIRDYTHEHKHYIAACLELDVSYKVIDLSAENWGELIENSGCDAFLVWPPAYLSAWKRMFDDRLRILAEEMNRVIYPTIKEIWLYESKTRGHYWMTANRIPHPETAVFYDESETLEHLAKVDYPIVFKADFGAGSHGVKICRRRKDAVGLVKSAFGRGFAPDRSDPRDRQWGYVIFQEYLPDVKEWRMVRIGDWYFCRLKRKKGDYHSGSGRVDWGKPSRELLDMTHNITERGGFTSMNLDVFETVDGRLLVNEMHTVFGDIKRENRGNNPDLMGRYRYDREKDEWDFQPGYFYDNACANLRVEHLLKVLAETNPGGKKRGG